MLQEHLSHPRPRLRATGHLSHLPNYWSPRRAAQPLVGLAHRFSLVLTRPPRRNGDIRSSPGLLTSQCLPLILAFLKSKRACHSVLACAQGNGPSRVFLGCYGQVSHIKRRNSQRSWHLALGPHPCSAVRGCGSGLEGSNMLLKQASKYEVPQFTEQRTRGTMGSWSHSPLPV